MLLDPRISQHIAAVNRDIMPLPSVSCDSIHKAIDISSMYPKDDKCKERELTEPLAYTLETGRVSS